MGNRELADRIALLHGRDRIATTAPEDIDTSDLDPVEADDWDDLQWARAERSGMMDEPGFWEKADPGGSDWEDGDDWEEQSDGPAEQSQEPEQGTRVFAVKVV